jgi:hypothetical protein
MIQMISLFGLLCLFSISSHAGIYDLVGANINCRLENRGFKTSKPVVHVVLKKMNVSNFADVSSLETNGISKKAVLARIAPFGRIEIQSNEGTQYIFENIFNCGREDTYVRFNKATLFCECQLIPSR